MLLEPSPNVQSQEVGLLVDVSVKVTVLFLNVKLATGLDGVGVDVTTMDLVLVLDPAVLLTVRDTLKVPACP